MRVSVGIVFGGIWACSDAAAPLPPAQRQLDIIGGFRADAAELDHTGALVAIDPVSRERSLFCTATLIAPDLLVTAKHCTQTFTELQALGLEVAFAAGASVADAAEVIGVVSAQGAPGDAGGFLGVGRDVAVCRLERTASIPPAVPAVLDGSSLGESMVSIGYGIFSPSGAQDGRRRIGRETVQATRGQVLEAMFGSFENFVEWNFTGQVTPSDFLGNLDARDPLVASALGSLRSSFDSLLLEPEYEAVTGLTRGDSQTCSGDSGGPLARLTRAGSWEVYGVVSGGLYSARSACDFGSVFATFGPETLAFLRAASAAATGAAPPAMALRDAGSSEAGAGAPPP